MKIISFITNAPKATSKETNLACIENAAIYIRSHIQTNRTFSTEGEL